jgi:ATP-binding cassette, subfamily B, bacterial PglK
MIDYKRVKCFYEQVDNTKKNKILFLIIFSIFASLSEIISIAAIIPFLTSLSNPSLMLDLPIIGDIVKKSNISDLDLLFYTTLSFILATILAYSLRLTLLWYTRKIAFDLGSDIAIKIFKNTLYKPYCDFLKVSSSELINILSVKVDRVVVTFILPTLEFITSLFLLIGIVVFLSFYAFTFSMLIFSMVFLSYLFVGKISKKWLSINSINISKEANQIVKISQDGFYGFKDIFFTNSQDYFVNKYSISDGTFRHSQAKNFFLNQSPRYLIEGLGMIFIIVTAYLFSRGSAGETGGVLTTIGVVVLALSKVLPLAQKLYANWSIKQGDLDSFLDVFKMAQLPNLFHDMNSNNGKFESGIKLIDLSYKYKSLKEYTIQNISLEIEKGSVVGLIGDSGTGKSTLASIISGVLSPTQGEILIDNINLTINNKGNWVSKTYQVSQNTYIFNLSIKQNVALGVDFEIIDEDRVKRCCEIAGICREVEKLDHGYDSYVGDNGSELSGGQRQRLAIARALYSEPELLIMDESLSGVSLTIERQILFNILKAYKSITIIMISHRHDILEECTHLINADNNFEIICK